ncbi:hypothetical protein SAMN05216386_0079 [Nitrosospira briensis]|uniref:Aminoglycoside phosphotransferase domain-containing protein n=1 Tax=Nitrosospira briensis TaxID=35799 RepID=A0A1I4XF44_9PROT|nr:bifunctional aminoglycoside phosphotransferase/ATP-binding protein [Nitrosospira briensis]SFN24282.1 hypothetical protein SAMN05216386_0079 [Nitrosospira briensis]
MENQSEQSKPPTDELKEGDVQSRLIGALMDRRRYPHAVKTVRVVETHISWVLLAGRYAYKIKKSVDLGFLNFTGLASRRHYCDEEIRLNRRLAPQIYLGVIPIGGTPEMPEFNATPAIEYAVRMRRFPASSQLDRLATRREILPRHIDSLAETIADFHSSLPSTEAGSAFGSTAAIRSAVFQSFDRLQAVLTDGESERRVIALRRACETEYASCKERFAQRREQGWVRECHGDLHLGNIALIEGKPVPFDGIEFDPALRWVDVMSEVAFTVMDLLYYRHSQLAYRFLNVYLQATGDYNGVPLLRFYIAYRAVVRAMVSAIRAEQMSLPEHAKAKAIADCRDFLVLAAERLGQYRPALIITYGLPGSGKTTFAQTALERLQAIRIRSDVERKRLFGLAPLADSDSHAGNIYDANATRRTYSQLHKLSRNLLATGTTVIVDAAFLKQDERERFRQLAHEMTVPFVIVAMRVATTILRARITQRQSESNDASEADLAVLELLQAKQEALSPVEQARTVEFANEEAGIEADVSGWKKLNHLLSSS